MSNKTLALILFILSYMALFFAGDPLLFVVALITYLLVRAEPDGI